MPKHAPVTDAVSAIAFTSTTHPPPRLRLSPHDTVVDACCECAGSARAGLPVSQGGEGMGEGGRGVGGGLCFGDEEGEKKKSHNNVRTSNNSAACLFSSLLLPRGG